MAWKSKIENILRELISNDVLKPIDHSDWGTPLVPIIKPDGNIRICGDYKVTINKHLLDFKYPLPLIDDLFASLQGGHLCIGCYRRMSHLSGPGIVKLHMRQLRKKLLQIKF